MVSGEPAASGAEVWLLCWACCFYLLISFLCVCVCVFREVALVWVGFFLTLLKNKLQSAKNLAFHSHWLGADAFL